MAGLLVAAYLVLLDGVPRWAGLALLAVGALLAALLVEAVTILPVRPSVWLVLAAAVAAPAALWAATAAGHERRDG